MEDLIKRLEANQMDDGLVAMAVAALHDSTVRKFWFATSDYGGREMQLELANGRLIQFDMLDWPGESLDSAVRSVPKDWRWQIRQDPECYRAGLHRGLVSNMELVRGEAKTPAAALFAAILRTSALKART